MRPSTVIPNEITDPYPIEYNSHVICGYGRGSSELGIPTANIPISEALNALETGIYFGVCQVSPNEDAQTQAKSFETARSVEFNNGKFLREADMLIQPMVMSVGWNPFYNNTQKAAEVHIIHNFEDDFYGAKIRVIVLGYIRPELNYTTKADDLIRDINEDVRIAKRALELEQFKIYLDD